MRFGKDLEGRKLRLHFSDGRASEDLIIDVAAPDDGDGFVIDPLDKELPSGDPALWTKFADLARYEALEN